MASQLEHRTSPGLASDLRWRSRGLRLAGEKEKKRLRWWWWWWWWWSPAEGGGGESGKGAASLAQQLLGLYALLEVHHAANRHAKVAQHLSTHARVTHALRTFHAAACAR